MIFLLPLWLTFGIAALGVNGWGGLFYFFNVAPLLLVSLAALAFIADYPKKGEQRPARDAQLLWALYASIFLHGLFLVDGGDTSESVGSVASHVVGGWFVGISSAISTTLFWVSAGLLIFSFVYFIGQRAKQNTVTK